MKITKCSCPIPKVKYCCNFEKGCWQCRTKEDLCWCYMAPRWKHWGLEIGEVQVNTDLTDLQEQIFEKNFQLQGNLLASSSHDPLHDECFETFNSILINLFHADESFWNGHKLHILSKRIARLFSLDITLPLDTRIWATITTPRLKQALEYQVYTDPPQTQTLALRRLEDLGYRDLGVSFGPMFSGWRYDDFERWVEDELPQLQTVQFERMNHGHKQFDCLSQEEVADFAQRFKDLRPETTVHLKESPFEVGRELRMNPEVVA